MNFKPQPFQIAGFELFGKLLPDGRIQIGSSDDARNIDIVDEFPERVDVCGATYTLEFVKANEVSGAARERMTPEQIADAERIRWGVYV